MGAHLVDGQFQSDKYPACPRGKVPLSVSDTAAQDLLWEYAQRRRVVDREFSDDLEASLISAGFTPPPVAMTGDWTNKTSPVAVAIDEHVRVLMGVAGEMKEKLVAMFVAETGAPPSECEFVIERTEHGSRCFIRRRVPAPPVGDFLVSASYSPIWGGATKVHDWRNYVSDELRAAWHTFTPLQRWVIAKSADAIASQEEWD